MSYHLFYITLAATHTHALMHPEFAGVLEDLESQFYSQALSKFQASDFTAAGFSDPNLPIQQFTAIGGDESTHLTTIQVRVQVVHTLDWGAK